MIEKPISFNEEMVRAIFAGRKSQTRRVIKDGCIIPNSKCRYGHQGDKLWIRETYYQLDPEHIAGNIEYMYKADIVTTIFEEVRQERLNAGFPYKWVSGRYMPRKAARGLLRVSETRIERVQDITIEDVLREGFPGCQPGEIYDPLAWFIELWDSINEKSGYSWVSNPYVWVVSFELMPS